MANAAVVGLLPGWRYVLLSDRLLETMSDEQIAQIPVIPSPSVLAELKMQEAPSRVFDTTKPASR